MQFWIQLTKIIANPCGLGSGSTMLVLSKNNYRFYKIVLENSYHKKLKKVESGFILPDYPSRIRIHSGVFKAIESAALRLGLVLELQYSARSLFPPSQYGGLTLQLIRVMPGRQRGASSQVHRVHILLEIKQG
jgi:hypothetical protein